MLGGQRMEIPKDSFQQELSWSIGIRDKRSPGCFVLTGYWGMIVGDDPEMLMETQLKMWHSSLLNQQSRAEHFSSTLSRELLVASWCADSTNRRKNGQIVVDHCCLGDSFELSFFVFLMPNLAATLLYVVISLSHSRFANMDEKISSQVFGATWLTSHWPK